MRKLDFLHMRKQVTDQLCSNCTADQCLCFRNMDSTIPLLLIKISSIEHSSAAVQADLCQTWMKILKISFLAAQLVVLKENK